MAQIAVLARKCTGCGACVTACPFASIQLLDGKVDIDAGCRLCGLCVKACPQGALMRLESARRGIDLQDWQGILVYAEASGGKLHPVSLELVGKAQTMNQERGQALRCVLVGEDLDACAKELRHYGVDEVLCYDDPAFAYFRADAYTDAVADAVNYCKPSIVLVGGTALGRSLAPRLSTRFRTGLTADCTELLWREDGNLVQIRPAFGGNIMAQIVTPYTRPQFATVRYKVMPTPERQEVPRGVITPRPTPKTVAHSPVRPVSIAPIPRAASISEAEVLVVGGRGLRSQADLALVRDLADALGGELAVTRPLVEKGWESNLRQIGLSGRTVRPKLIITCGVSGAIQFTACMNASERIVAINTDPEAPIFKVAHVGVIGDLYEIVPELIRAARGEGQ